MNDRKSRGKSRPWPPLVLVVAGIAGGAAGMTAQETPSTLPPEPGRPTILSALGAEAQRYGRDARAFLSAPLEWDGGRWAEAASVVGSLALLSTQDSRIDSAFQRNRSPATNAVARDVTPLGSYAGVLVSSGWLGAGFLLRDSAVRNTGRDMLEAELFAAGIVTPVLKQALGRMRPVQGSDGDEFRPLSSSRSFPSGHSAEAFSVASVIAARAQGWVVPTIAYTLASGVALARMNDRAHFASDVVAGAVIGTAIGRSIVHRHAQTRETIRSWKLIPVTSPRGGIGIGIGLASGR